jgi:hypothetical protein
MPSFDRNHGDGISRSVGSAGHWQHPGDTSTVYYGEWDAAGDQRIDLSDGELGLGLPVSAGDWALGEYGSFRGWPSAGPDGGQHPEPAGNIDNSGTSGSAVRDRPIAAVNARVVRACAVNEKEEDYG